MKRQAYGLMNLGTNLFVSLFRRLVGTLLFCVDPEFRRLAQSKRPAKHAELASTAGDSATAGSGMDESVTTGEHVIAVLIGPSGTRRIME